MSIITKVQNRFGIFGELLAFLWKRKLWWMIPMILVLALLIFLLVCVQSTGPLAPFIYPFF